MENKDPKKPVDEVKPAKVKQPAEVKPKYVFVNDGKLTKPNGEVKHFKAGDPAFSFSDIDLKHYLANGILKKV